MNKSNVNPFKTTKLKTKLRNNTGNTFLEKRRSQNLSTYRDFDARKLFWRTLDCVPPNKSDE